MALLDHATGVSARPVTPPAESPIENPREEPLAPPTEMTRDQGPVARVAL